MPNLPKDAAERKARPIVTGVIDYFPDALAEVAYCSKVGNDQHNPGQPLHWAKEKSTDEPDALVRHLIDRGKRDSDGVRHSAKVAWRALAMLQREIEAERETTTVDDAAAERERLYVAYCNGEISAKEFDRRWAATFPTLTEAAAAAWERALENLS